MFLRQWMIRNRRSFESFTSHTNVPNRLNHQFHVMMSMNTHMILAPSLNRGELESDAMKSVDPTRPNAIVSACTRLPQIGGMG